MKQDWLVENEDARKTLHDLYFETGSLPDQQPKVKAKEPEKTNPVEQPTPSAPAGMAEVARRSTDVDAGTSSGSWLKRTVYITLALLLAFAAYQEMPKLDVSESKATPRHAHSPLIREALERRQAPSSSQPARANLWISGSLAVTPTVIMAQYQPGQSIAQTLTVDNQSPNAMTFEMEAEDLVAQGEELTLVPAGDFSGSVAATAVFSQRYVQVGPMEKAAVQMTLTCPAGTTVRGVLARFRSTDMVPSSVGGTISTSLGTLITFVRHQDSPGQDPVATAGFQPSQAHFTISQWSTEGNTSASVSGTSGVSKNSKDIKAANYAGLGENQ